MLQSLSPSIKSLIMDMDGVLWKGDEPLVDLPKILLVLQNHGIKFLFATNNATKTVVEYQNKFKFIYNLEIESWQIITSALAAADYLSHRFPEFGNINIIGGKGLIEALQQKGFNKFNDDSEIIAVVVGLDLNLTYEKLRTATLHIRSGKPFIGTNPDLTYPSPEGPIPGAGSILAALEAATGVKPIIIGKPHPPMLRTALERLGTLPEQTLVVGDRLDTDIFGGKTIGCRTALVLTGISNIKEVETSSFKPDLVAQSLEVLCQ
jgi:4-nitrophenyl phosphatase